MGWQEIILYIIGIILITGILRLIFVAVDNKKSGGDLNFTSFLRPEFLLWDMGSGKKIPKTSTDFFFVSVWRFIVIVALVLLIAMGLYGKQAVLSWLERSWSGIIYAIVAYFIYTGYLSKSKKD